MGLKVNRGNCVEALRSTDGGLITGVVTLVQGDELMVRPLGEHNPIPCFSVGRVVDLDELGEAQLEQAKLIQVDITYHDNKTRRL